MFHLKGNTIPGTESTLAEGKEKLRSEISWERHQRKKTKTGTFRHGRIWG
jgi:hypothetical protein